jgi:hypothetical protein
VCLSGLARSLLLFVSGRVTWGNDSGDTNHVAPDATVDATPPAPDTAAVVVVLKMRGPAAAELSGDAMKTRTPEAAESAKPISSCGLAVQPNSPVPFSTWADEGGHHAPSRSRNSSDHENSISSAAPFNAKRGWCTTDARTSNASLLATCLASALAEARILLV